MVMKKVRTLAKRNLWALGLLGWLLFLAGCGIEKTDPGKLRDLEFTLVDDSQIPEELKPLIEEKKAAEFKMSFDTGEFRYIAVGYGAQKTGGYSIMVEALYETRNAIYIKTNLMGPAKGETVTEVESYPYVVIKTEFLDKSVVFE